MTSNDLASRFASAAADETIVDARYHVLDTCADGLANIADGLHATGYIIRDDHALATALLARLTAELASGIASLLRQANTYAAAALLRQLIEVEYLAFLGYVDLATLAEWYHADPRTLRTKFRPQTMRDESDGLFRDQEYWLHCEVGGHPHPRARMVLAQYRGPIDPVAFLLPDSVHHLRRLWTSMRHMIPKCPNGDELIRRFGSAIETAIDSWETSEDSVILQFDGIPRTTDGDRSTSA